jgi:hypothetical protein
MARQVLVSALLVAALLVASHVAFAQAEDTGRIYVAALVNVPWSQGVTEDGFQLYRLPPGGWSLGWSVLGGVFVVPRASVEFEFAQTGVLKRTEPSRYGYTYHEERRDNFFTTAVRLHVRPEHAVDIEPVFGFDVVKEETWSASDRVSYTGGPTDHSARYESTLPAAAGFSLGADLRVGSAHAAFVASFRVHRTFWGGSGDFDETKQWTLRPGAGLRVVF